MGPHFWTTAVLKISLSHSDISFFHFSGTFLNAKGPFAPHPLQIAYEKICMPYIWQICQMFVFVFVKTEGYICFDFVYLVIFRVEQSERYALILYTLSFLGRNNKKTTLYKKKLKILRKDLNEKKHDFCGK